MSTPTNKVLLVFCDGTGADGNLSSSKGDGVQESTNVLDLSRAVLPYTTDGRRQIVFYQSGIATEADFAGKADASDTLAFLAGTDVASKIRDAYAFIAQNYDAGDEISIFGFSRGAFTARKLAGLIDKIGLLQTQSLGYLFDIWADLIAAKQPTIPAGTRQPRIRCVGVWDTVGAVLNEINALSIQDTYLPPTVDCALHAMALQENRKSFLNTLWTIPPSGLAKLPDGSTQVVKQIWFPGGHPDVGGPHDTVPNTYNGRELSDLTLFWMAGEIQGFINIDTNFVRRCAQPSPQPWGTTQPHNTYEELSLADKILIGHETRLEGGQITASSIFHSSLAAAPTTLTSPTYMVTLAILKKQFGASWVPTYAPLNAFEQYCQAHWGQAPSKSAAPVIKTPAALIRSSGKQ